MFYCLFACESTSGLFVNAIHDALGFWKVLEYKYQF